MANNNNNEVRITFKAFNQEFNNAVKGMNDETKKLRQEMKLQEEQMKHGSTESEKLEASLNGLQKIYELTQRKTAETAAALARARDQWGENSVEAKRYEELLKRAQIAEQQAANAITAKQQALERARQAQEDQTKSLRQLQNLFTATNTSIEDFSNVLGRDLTRAIQAGTANANQLDRAFNQIAQTTQHSAVNVQELRQVLSQLDSGASVETVQNGLRALNNVTRTTADEIKQLQQAMRLEQEQMRHTATESDKLNAKLRSLEAIHAAMQRETQETAAQLQAAKAAYGENSRQVQQLEAQLQQARIAQQQMANSMTETRQAVQTQENAFNQLRALFQTTGRSLNDFTDLLGSDLTRAIQNGTANANDLNRAFDRIAQSAVGAGADINEVRQVLARLDGSNIEEIRRDLERLGAETEEATTSIRDMGEALAGAATAAIGMSTAISESLDAASLNTKIDLTFAVSDESKESIRQVTRDVQSFGVGAEEALEGVRRQWALNRDATDEANAEVVKGAAAIARAYDGIDFIELIQETNEIGKELKISDQAALDLVNNLLRVGFPPEQLDIIAEYGQQLQRAGFEAKEIQGIMAAAVASGSWNIDNLLDGLKEGRVRAAEMGVELTTGMKDAVREAVGTTEKISDEQLSAMQKGLAQQEAALSKSLDNRTNAIAKSHRQQQSALDKQLSNEFNAVSKNYEKQQKALEKSLSASYDATVKNYEKQQKELEKSLEKELRDFEKLSEEKIKIIDKEYLEKMKLIDEDKYNQLKALDAQIDALNAQTDAEDKAIKQKETAEKRAELATKARNAKTVAERQEADKAIRDFEEKLQLEATREQRKNQIDNLKSQKDNVKEASDAQKDALKSETDERKEQVKEQINNEKDAMKERHSVIKEDFQQRKQEELKALSESNKAQIDALREVNQARLSSLREEHNARKNALSERLSNEMNAVREAHKAELDSFKEMNKEKLELAKNPPDSAAVQAVFNQLEGFGRAIAEGGEEGSKAFEDMVAWLASIEDATLRNAIGTEIFGTMWEDQGEHIVNSIMNADEALAQMEETQQSVNELQEGFEEDPYIEIANAINQIREALDPLMGVLAAVISQIANFAAKNPEITSLIVGVVGAIGTLTGAFFALSPVIGFVQKLFGTGGLSSVLSKIGPVITGLATKILPALRIAFGLLTGPIGMAVTVITVAATLIIKYWEPISKFFSDLWEGIKKIFSDTITAIWDFVKKYWDLILAAITSPVGVAVKFVKDNWEDIKKATKDIFDNVWSTVKGTWDKIYNAIKSPIESARDAVKDAIEKIKGFFKFNFEWPKLKVPKFSLKGSINPLDWFGEGLPKIDIQWHAKGAVFSKPTLFNTSRGLRGVGEAGPEAVLPLNERVLGSIGDAIFAASGAQQAGPTNIYNYERMMEGATFNIREEADIHKLARELFTIQQRDRKGR
ncbi:tape measure protein [Metasolibacillus meyeri]|uniref:tape measure protein n=1 Tax=Metasolibacillus meyeri TaxID=1071052 RepID=UPI000D305F72|nr:tape measure protein [Metasolibacillus meyeri]